jgi:RalA-binding protein 1
LIIESKRGAANRHVLCAESDAERDSWIETLVKHVEPEKPLASQRGAATKPRDVVITAAQPISSMADSDSKLSGAPSPSLFNAMEQKRVTQISIPSSSSPKSYISSPIAYTSPMLSQAPSYDSFSSSPPLEQTPRATKRQSIVPPGRQSYSPAYLSKLSSDGMPGPPGWNPDRDRKAKSGRFWGFGKTSEKLSRPVFGVTLSESIAIATVGNLPAIVFRCIEYLEAKKAEQEEGIYRLSGSSAVIKGLKDRFDMEGDVNLLALDEHWDPHAIAGLLKTFLREMSSSLLTRDLHMRFLAVMGEQCI